MLDPDPYQMTRNPAVDKLFLIISVTGLSRAACPATCATRSWPRCTRPAGRRRGVRGGWTLSSTPLSTTSPSSSHSPSASSSSSYFSPSPTSGLAQCSGLVPNDFLRIRGSTPRIGILILLLNPVANKMTKKIKFFTYFLCLLYDSLKVAS